MLLAAFFALSISACGSSIDASTTAPPASTSSTSKPLPVGAFHLQANRKTIIDSGERIAVQPASVIGYVDNVISEGNAIALSGWTADASLSHPANAVVAFVGNKTIAALEPSGDRPDVAEGYNKPGIEHSGFLLSIPLRSLDCSAPNQDLTVFGLAGKTASSLVWLADTRQLVGKKC